MLGVDCLDDQILEMVKYIGKWKRANGRLGLFLLESGKILIENLDFCHEKKLLFR